MRLTIPFLGRFMYTLMDYEKHYEIHILFDFYKETTVNIIDLDSLKFS